jgi:beta-N-acetylhexosaminidase
VQLPKLIKDIFYKLLTIEVMDKQTAARVVLGSLAGTKLSQQEKHILTSYDVPGVTLFSRNVVGVSAKQFSFDLSKLQEYRRSAAPYLICVDQEGGRVSRLKNLNCPDLGPSLFLADGSCEQSSLGIIKKYGKDLGQALLHLGVNVNFAPVVDILTNKDNHAIGDRVFGLDAVSVIKRSRAFLSGLQQAGIVGCLKHFPGQGDASFDTHLSSATIAVKESVLRSRELLPFTCLSAQMVMLSHCVYPSLCSYEASRSAAIITGVLRKEIGYKGLVVSDDLTMGAVANCEKDWQEFICDSMAAGTDLLLVCKDSSLWVKAIETLARQAQKSSFFQRRLQEAAARVVNLQKSLVK